ncbi:IS1096 element passenger TnpR family protein [Nonomuraea jabiensis]|uniref:IS1096 element passenger TnpR family protein n=1 Tax=Nonomuraea jabiensis TaxID=882448 RepID=UPI00368E62CB
MAEEGASPPEDCGGTWGYREFRAALADPRHEEHEHLVRWAGLTSAASGAGHRLISAATVSRHSWRMTTDPLPGLVMISLRSRRMANALRMVSRPTPK